MSLPYRSQDVRERWVLEMAYVRTTDGLQVDFLAASPGGTPLLLQVCVDVQDPQTYEREVRALAAGAKEHRRPRPLLMTLESTPSRPSLPPPLEWQCAADWLLAEPGAG